jgi:hypothetical protein
MLNLFLDRTENLLKNSTSTVSNSSFSINLDTTLKLDLVSSYEKAGFVKSKGFSRNSDGPIISPIINHHWGTTM